ncbi:hypothetical protein FRB96_006498 [Tulasnella sp. 330]|nr:hypothetical protein FRB96_006498 [Tulasnella sp. 330]
MAGKIELTLEFYFTLVAQTNAARLSMIAGYTWVIYDWLITIDQEIAYVWSQPSGWKSKALFGFTRYYGIILLTYDLIVLTGMWGTEFCHDYFFILGGGGLLLLFAVEGALQMRVFALYNGNKKLMIFNLVFFVLDAISVVTLVMIDTASYTPLQTPPGLSGCFSTGFGQNYSRFIWWMLFAFESWLSFLVARKAYQNYREFGIKSHVLLILIRDSFLWYFLLAGCLMWMGLAFAIAPPGLLLLGVPFTHAAATIGGSRLLLNLRAAHYARTQQDTTLTSQDATIGAWKKPAVRPRRDAGWRASDTLNGGVSTFDGQWGVTSTLKGDMAGDYNDFGLQSMDKRDVGDRSVSYGQDLEERTHDEMEESHDLRQPQSSRTEPEPWMRRETARLQDIERTAGGEGRWLQPQPYEEQMRSGTMLRKDRGRDMDLAEFPTQRQRSRTLDEYVQGRSRASGDLPSSQQARGRERSTSQGWGVPGRPNDFSHQQGTLNTFPAAGSTSYSEGVDVVSGGRNNIRFAPNRDGSEPPLGQRQYEDDHQRQAAGQASGSYNGMARFDTRYQVQQQGGASHYASEHERGLGRDTAERLEQSRRQEGQLENRTSRLQGRRTWEGEDEPAEVVGMGFAI